MFDASKFWSKIDKGDGRGCWLWVGSKNARGYGQLTINCKTHKAHRVMWEITHGEIPAGMFVCHSCDNPTCVNHRHLFLGTCADNNADMLRKGRQVPGRGANMKLTELEVRVVKKLITDGHSKASIGRRFGVTRSTISKIANGKNWVAVRSWS